MTAIEIDNFVCGLCDGEGVLISAANVISCPVCTLMEVKNEFERIDVKGLEIAAMRTLLHLGWEIRDACYALKETTGDVAKADSVLRDRSRQAAEAGLLDEAALNSEADKKSRQNLMEETLHSAVFRKDGNALWMLPSFSAFFAGLFASTSHLQQWLDENVDENTADLLFRYLRLRMQAFRWYAGSSEKFFLPRDRQVLRGHLRDTLINLVNEVEENLYALGPNAFNQIEVDSEVEIIESETIVDRIDVSDS